MRFTQSSARLAIQINKMSSIAELISRSCDDNEPRTRPIFQKPGEVPRHGFPVVRNHNAPRFRRGPEYVKVGHPDNAAFVGIAEIDRRFPPPQAPHAFLIETGIGLKADSHYWEL